MAAVGRVTLRSGQNINSGDEAPQPQAGKVGDVVRKWLVYEDSAIANQIQQREIQDHFDKNRNNRRTVREDIPVAKQVFSQEEARAQYERMRQLEEQRRIAEEDAEIARNLERQIIDKHKEEIRKKQMQDEAMAQQIRQSEPRPHPGEGAGAVSPTANDYYSLEDSRPRFRDSPNRQPELNAEVNWRGGDNSHHRRFESDYEDDFDDEALEAEDRELALRLQQEEEERYERKKQQRALAKERKKLERLINQQQMQDNRELSPRVPRPEADEFSNFYVPPDPKMSPDESRRLQEEQDAELARLIQDREQTRPSRNSLRERLRQIETQDAELARIIQEEENLRAKRRALKQKQKILGQQREVAERMASHQSSPNSTMVSNGSGSRLPPHTELASEDPRRPTNAVVPRSRPPTNFPQMGTRVDNSPLLPNRSMQYSTPGRADSLVSSSPHDSDVMPRSGRTTREDITSSSASTAAPTPRSRAAVSCPASRQANIPLNLPGRLLHSKEAEPTDSGRGGPYIRLPPEHCPQPPPELSTQRVDERVRADERLRVPTHQPLVRQLQVDAQWQPNRFGGDMYAERPIDRGAYSPNRRRESSPPGPALPERKYREQSTSPNDQSPVNTNNGNSNVRHHNPPYRQLQPPPYQAAHSLRATSPGEGANVPSPSPRSADTHYETPWDFSQLENQLLREASSNQPAQPIKPVQVSPPGRRTRANPSPDRSIVGPGGRPLLEHNENGQIVMNIAEAIDPTYTRRSVHTQRPISEHYPGGEEVPEGEITAVAGQRRSTRKAQGNKRDSCKQQ